MNIKKIAAGALNPAPYNPRKDLKPGDAEYDKLKRSIQEFGYVEPLVWNSRTGNIIGGHQRYKVLVAMGYEEIDCVVLDIDEPQEKALNVALNKISGAWDMEQLANVFRELDNAGVDMTVTGFDADEISALFDTGAEVQEDDFDLGKALEDAPPPTIQKGDIIALGRHRLMCGDATDADDIRQLMAGATADMVFTDPPYNVNYEGAAGKIKNDNMGNEAFYDFLYDAFSRARDALKPGGAMYVCHADTESGAFRTAFVDAGLLFKQSLVWVKNHFTLGRQDYQWQHEPIIYGWKPGAPHAWHGGRKKATVWPDDAAVTAAQQPDGSWMLTFNNGVTAATIQVPEYKVIEAETTVWRIDRPQRSREHPTMKPICLCARAIQNSSRRDGIVLDAFGGSGSTLLAAEQLGRTCYMMELDPVYCDVIKTRYERYMSAQEKQ